MKAKDLAQMGVRIDRAIAWEPHLNAAMAEFGIDTPIRRAAFLAQVLHESGLLRWVTEIWGPTPAQSRYEGRKDLGNVRPGDGIRFKGRGLIQTTGRDNYNTTGRALGVDLLTSPEILAEPAWAARSAAWYWQSRKLNALADSGDFLALTRRINGGTNGLADRMALHSAATEALA